MSIALQLFDLAYVLPVFLQTSRKYLRGLLFFYCRDFTQPGNLFRSVFCHIGVLLRCILSLIGLLGRRENLLQGLLGRKYVDRLVYVLGEELLEFRK